MSGAPGFRWCQRVIGSADRGGRWRWRLVRVIPVLVTISAIVAPVSVIPANRCTFRTGRMERAPLPRAYSFSDRRASNTAKKQDGTYLRSWNGPQITALAYSLVGPSDVAGAV